MIGYTDDQCYQGGISNVYEILGRFSSRRVKNEYMLPFPVDISTLKILDEVDNFDYVSMLYNFFTGDTHLKLLFTKPPANGILQVAVGSSKGSRSDTDFNAGNSISTSHQAVWPLLELTYPYMSVVPYNTVHAPFFLQEETFPFVVDSTAELSKYWIAASPTFELAYLMPVPDFCFLEEAQFQSGRNNYPISIALAGARTMAGSYFNIEIPIDNATAGTQLSIDFDVCAHATRTSGTVDDTILVFLGPAPYTAGISGAPVVNLGTAYAAGSMLWVDSTNSGKNNATVQFSGSWYGVWASSIWLNFVRYSNATATFDITYSLRTSPFSRLNCPTSLGTTSTLKVGNDLSVFSTKVDSFDPTALPLLYPRSSAMGS
jgi:hypothetical protein